MTRPNDRPTHVIPVQHVRIHVRLFRLIEVRHALALSPNGAAFLRARIPSRALACVHM